MFSYLVGIAPDGVKWHNETWHHFLYLLNCLRILLAGKAGHVDTCYMHLHFHTFAQCKQYS